VFAIINTFTRFLYIAFVTAVRHLQHYIAVTQLHYEIYVNYIQTMTRNLANLCKIAN